MLDIVSKITSGEMCDLCDGGWHELSKVELEGKQLNASILCIDTGETKAVSISIDDQ